MAEWVGKLWPVRAAAAERRPRWVVLREAALQIGLEEHGGAVPFELSGSSLDQLAGAWCHRPPRVR